MKWYEHLILILLVVFSLTLFALFLDQRNIIEQCHEHYGFTIERENFFFPEK